MLQEPTCFKRKCIHFLGIRNDGDETTERVYCLAFPDGIPATIAYGNNKHSKKHKGQEGEYIFKKDKRG